MEGIGYMKTEARGSVRKYIGYVLKAWLSPNNLLVAGLWIFTALFWLGAFNWYRFFKFRFLGHGIEYYNQFWCWFWN